MKVNPIKQQNLSQKGKVTVISKNFPKKELQTIINNEKMLAEFARKQKFNYTISKNKKEKDAVCFTIVDKSDGGRFFRLEEKLTTKVKDLDNTKMFEAMKKLTQVWENKTPFAELSLSEKLKRVFSVFYRPKQV